LQGSFAWEELNQQGQLDYAAAQGQAQTQSYQAQGAAQMARDMNEARLTQAMSEHDAIQKAWTSGEVFTTDEQFQQAQAAWSAKYPDMGGWGLPERIAQQQGDMVEQQQIESIIQNFGTDHEGNAFVTPDAVQQMRQNMEFKDMVAQLSKDKKAILDRKKLQMDADATEVEGAKKAQIEQQKSEAKAAEKKIIAQEKIKDDSIIGEQEYKAALMEHRNDMVNVFAKEKKQYDEELKTHNETLMPEYEAQMAAYEDAKKAHNSLTSMMKKDGKGNKPFSGKMPTKPIPPVEPVPPSPPLPMNFGNKIPQPSSEAEMLALPPYTRFLDPNGQIRIKQP
jgi:hypothetical protein